MPVEQVEITRSRGQRRSRRWIEFSIALCSFAAGSLLSTFAVRAQTAAAESDRIFELLVYHALPGKAPALESIFRDVSKLQARHGLNVVGYWVPNSGSGWDDTFVYLVAHHSASEAASNWKALHADPEFKPYVKPAAELIEKVEGRYRVDEVYMRASDYSGMK